MIFCVGCKRNGDDYSNTVLSITSWLMLCIVFGWVYGPIMISMVENWYYDENYSHGFFIPIVSLAMLFAKRREIRKLDMEINWTGLVIIGIGLFLLVIGEFGHEFFLKRVSIVPVLWGLVILICGWAIAKVVIFPFAYLILMVPLPYVLYDSIAFPLRLIAASIAEKMLESWGLPVLLEGNRIILPRIQLDVVDACSGIRSLVSLFALGIIISYVLLPKIWQRSIIIVLVLPVTVLSNALRVAITGILGENYGKEMIAGTAHDLMGWVVFMSAFILILGFTLLLKLFIKNDKMVNE